MKTKDILLYLFLFLSININGQIDKRLEVIKCKKEVLTINSTPLKRAVVGAVDNKLSNSSLIFDNDLIRNNLYIDSLHRVRKYIRSTDEESLSRSIICYYNEDGNLIYMIYRSMIEGTDSCFSSISETGYFYVNGNKILEFENRQEKYTYSESSTILYNRDVPEDFFLKVGGIEIEAYGTSSKLLDQFDIHISNLEKLLPSLPSVLFDNTKGLTFVSRNDVFIRQGAGKNYPPDSVLRTIDAGRILQLKPINQKTNKIREDSWCRVTEPFTGVEGYIYSAFLEPIERVIEE